jgi:hypothetical protein
MVLSLQLKLFLEPFLYEKSSRRTSGKVSDEHLSESVASFFERHFGKEVVDYLIDPFVAGTSGGDPESLSVSYYNMSHYLHFPYQHLCISTVNCSHNYFYVNCAYKQHMCLTL